jgi:enoyl-CoA hydratase/carnithine racemase
MKSMSGTEVVLRGIPTAFCAGADLMEHANEPEKRTSSMDLTYHLLHSLKQHQNVLSVLEGHVIGAGAGLASA